LPKTVKTFFFFFLIFNFFSISIYFLLFYILISLINIQNFSRWFFFFSSPACSISALAGNFFSLFFFFFSSLTGNFFKGRQNLPLPPQMKSNPKLKSGLSSETSTLHLRHRQKGQKITNFSDQQKEPKWSKNHHKKRTRNH
jgi:hypothetical protein